MLVPIIAFMGLLVLAALLVKFVIDRRIASEMMIEPAQFRSKNLRVNSLLANVPLVDVWVVSLPGGGDGRTILDLRSVLSKRGEKPRGFIVRTLVGVRLALGKIFGWDDEQHFVQSASYIHRLSERLWRRSLDEPGSKVDFFRAVYTFENESVAEIINGTVHAFLAMALEKKECGYCLYYAVYVKPVSWLTPVYMAMINPFRRLLVYPTMLTAIRRSWVEEYDPLTSPMDGQIEREKVTGNKTRYRQSTVPRPFSSKLGYRS